MLLDCLTGFAVLLSILTLVLLARLILMAMKMSWEKGTVIRLTAQDQHPPTWQVSYRPAPPEPAAPARVRSDRVFVRRRKERPRCRQVVKRLCERHKVDVEGLWKLIHRKSSPINVTDGMITQVRKMLAEYREASSADPTFLALCSGVADDPDDATGLMVLSDWLEESGDAAGAATARWMLSSNKRPRRDGDFWVWGTGLWDDPSGPDKLPEVVYNVILRDGWIFCTSWPDALWQLRHALTELGIVAR